MFIQLMDPKGRKIYFVIAEFCLTLYFMGQYFNDIYIPEISEILLAGN